MRKIAITGANGLLGQKLLTLLAHPAFTQHFDVLATSKDLTMPLLAELNVHRHVPLDITDEKALYDFFAQEKPHILLNCAAMTQVDACETEREKCWQVNVTAVENMAKICQKYDTFFLHLSTDFIFDGEKGNYTETDAPNPISFYGESKLASEKAIQQIEGLRWAIVRTILVFGFAPHLSRTNIVLWVKDSLEKNKTIQVVDDQWRTPTLAEDLAQGCMLITEKEAEGIFNIGGKDLMTPYEMALQVAKVFELDTTLIQKTDGTKFQQAAKRPPQTGLNIEKAKSLLQYEPLSFEKALLFLKEQLTQISQP